MKQKTSFIGINFQDNDFIKTFFNVARVLHDLPSGLTKKDIVTIINELSYGYYLLYQNYPAITPKSYLMLEEENIYLDNEVAEWIHDTGRHNGSFVYICPDDRFEQVFIA